jgi:hypothetical protein
MTEETEKSALGHIPPKKRTVKPSLPKTAMSLKPGAQLLDLLTLPNPTERVLAIRDAWKFNAPDEQGRPQFPVTQSEVWLESTGEIIFAPDQETSRGVHRNTSLFKSEAKKAIASVLGDDEAYL